eukprot:sb/3477946/
MFMYSMHHLHYYWMFVWPFIVPAGMVGMAIFRAVLEFGSLLRADMKYLGSATAATLEEDGITAANSFLKLNRNLTNQNSLFRSRDWLSANQGPVFPDSVGSCNA